MIERKALYFSPIAAGFDDFLAAQRRLSGVNVEQTATGAILEGRNLRIHLECAHQSDEARGRMRAVYFDLLILDGRDLGAAVADATVAQIAATGLLDALRSEGDPELRFPLSRAVALIGGADPEVVDRLIFSLGERYLGACLHDLSLSAGRGADALAKARLAEQFWTFCDSVLLHCKPGKKSINLAGGGISGIFYELGVVKCLQDSCDCDLRDFDMFFGISAGAFVAAGLANGFHINDLLADLGKPGGAWPSEFRLRLRHLNFGELPRRLGTVQKNMAQYLVRMLRGKVDFSVSRVFGTYAAMLGPMFDNTEIERTLREVFSVPGHTNDFRALARELYISATDQDSREPVLFGDEPWRDVPISQAIQASSASHPFFTSVQIGDRRYTDGMVTRTSNVSTAIHKGADLVFVIDPFVPLIVDTPGTNARHGNLWLIIQDLKTIAFTRFARVREEILRQNSQVSVYTFVPSNRMRELMSQNPFATRNFHPIVCEAYKSTYRRMRQIEHKLGAELALHGIHLDLNPVAAHVARLASAHKPDARILLASGSDRGDAATAL
jgi:NTE family protein